MGDLTLLGFGILVIVGIALVVVGAPRRSRPMWVPGAALHVAIAGAWVIGPIGLLLGALVLGFGLRGRARPSQ
jgi:hypothetical protein